MTDEIAFSRTAKGAGAAFGKNTRRIEFTLPEEAGDILEHKAASMGMELAAFMRVIGLTVAHGADEYERRCLEHTRATLGIAGLFRGNSGIDSSEDRSE